MDSPPLDDETVSGTESEAEEQLVAPAAQSARQGQNALFMNLLVLILASNS